MTNSPPQRSVKPRPLTHKGFTLLELLVVMVLLAMLMTGLVSAMRTMAQTESRVDQRLQRLNELRTTHAFLSQTLEGLSVTRVDAPEGNGKTEVTFKATAASVVWVGILPARPNVGGRYFFHLAVESLGAGNALALRLAPCDANMTAPDWSSTEPHLLVSGIDKLVIQAQGTSPLGHEREISWPVGWQAGWPVADVLPEQLRLSFQDSGRNAEQDWIFAVRPLIQGDDAVGTVSFGGGKK